MAEQFTYDELRVVERWLKSDLVVVEAAYAAAAEEYQLDAAMAWSAAEGHIKARLRDIAFELGELNARKVQEAIEQQEGK